MGNLNFVEKVKSELGSKAAHPAALRPFNSSKLSSTLVHRSDQRLTEPMRFAKKVKLIGDSSILRGLSLIRPRPTPNLMGDSNWTLWSCRFVKSRFDCF